MIWGCWTLQGESLERNDVDVPYTCSDEDFDEKWIRAEQLCRAFKANDVECLLPTTPMRVIIVRRSKTQLHRSETQKQRRNRYIIAPHPLYAFCCLSHDEHYDANLTQKLTAVLWVQPKVFEKLAIVFHGYTLRNLEAIPIATLTPYHTALIALDSCLERGKPDPRFL